MKSLFSLIYNQARDLFLVLILMILRKGNKILNLVPVGTGVRYSMFRGKLKINTLYRPINVSDFYEIYRLPELAFSIFCKLNQIEESLRKRNKD